MNKDGIINLLSVNNSRVVFKESYLYELIKIASKKVGNQKILANKLGFSRGSTISKYKKGLQIPSCSTVKKIAKIVEISTGELIDNIKEIRKENWWRKECGRKGGITTFRKYGSEFYKKLNGKLQEKYDHKYFKNLGFKTYKKYGKEHMRKMASKAGKLLPVIYPEEKKKWGKIGGMIGPERQKPTKQEINLMEENIKSGINNFKVHKSIGNGEGFKNFDFVYFLNDKIALIEEVTDIPPIKNRICSKVLEIYESKIFLKKANIFVPMILTFNYEKESTTKIRAPLDAINILLQENILPVFYDRNPTKRITLIEGILNSNNIAIQEYKTVIKKWFQDEMIKRMDQIKEKARGQLKVTMNKEEMLLNKKLIEHGFEPKGKYLLFSKYGAVVVDNFVELKNNRILFEVKKIKDRRSFLKAALDLAAKFFVIKRLYDTQAKCVAVLVSDNKIKLNSESYQIKLLEKYSDIIIKNDNFDKLKLLGDV